eukprot:CAMPEP_0202872444 /NCGR_PEP_ID=MMETSP1391-20130828/21230_1 /ASSEMBLY_ACC=CAM_ASM_000867 /TAXON_ID=1034604 /ORGANISM="Chlamydomonas leiostraca, Strain SAG 11-49" /LENGTH=95 /DNA_ID=CAMNT_0049553487 /DNA_START=231 /DNA_END=515 /DNA_ORIENTATION=-
MPIRAPSIHPHCMPVHILLLLLCLTGEGCRQLEASWRCCAHHLGQRMCQLSIPAALTLTVLLCCAAQRAQRVDQGQQVAAGGLGMLAAGKRAQHQ